MSASTIMGIITEVALPVNPARIVRRLRGASRAEPLALAQAHYQITKTTR